VSDEKLPFGVEHVKAACLDIKLPPKVKPESLH
jgi:hypothetical protein